jgi:hypothetical protein
VHKLTADKTYKNKVIDGMMAPGGVASGHSPEWDEGGNPLSKTDDEKFIESQKKRSLGSRALMNYRRWTRIESEGVIYAGQIHCKTWGI